MGVGRKCYSHLAELISMVVSRNVESGRESEVDGDDAVDSRKLYVEEMVLLHNNSAVNPDEALGKIEAGVLYAIEVRA